MSATPSAVYRTTETSTNGGIDNRFVIARCNRITSQVLHHAKDNQETSEESDSEERRRDGGVIETRSRLTVNEVAAKIVFTGFESSSIRKRLLTVCCRSGRLGAAAYTIGTGELQILEEIVDRPPDHQIFLTLFHQIDPAKLILDGKSQGTFVSVVKRLVFSDANEAKCKLIFVSNKEYNFEACKRRIYSLSLPHEPSNCSDEERTLFIRTVIDFSQTQTVHALGAMLRYLDLNWTNLCMNLHGRPEFLSLKRISLHDIVSIDEDTYKGLQIFSSLGHPSGFKRGVQGSNKEGLSLFQMFSKCASKVGHRHMRVFLRHPTKDMATLNRRQDVIAFFMRPQSDSIVRNICSSLRFIKNVNGILAKIKALSAKPYQWKSLYNTLYHVVLICEMCENTRNEYLEQLALLDTNKLYEMALYMNRIIDFDLSKSEGKFTVKAGVDSDLDMKKQTMASLHGLMSETAKFELERLPPFIEECTMLYMPHLGYLLGVKAWEQNLSAEGKELPDMKFMNNDYIHYKSRGCEELDVMIGDTYPEVVAHETRIMMRLTTIILENLHSLAAVIDQCAELDCLITISKVCKEYNFVQPTLTTDKVIDIKQGRHPLLITTCDNFVPNDITCSKEAGFIKILTGPNASGKSVYMKQTGLIVYLAHIGSFIPAEAATIGIIGHIFSRIQSTESVATHMSAFLIDLRQVSLALRSRGSHSLVLIEELGAGSRGGASLAAAVVAALARAPRDHNTPDTTHTTTPDTTHTTTHAVTHALLTTHYTQLRDYVTDDAVRFLSMEYMLHEGSPVFLYRAVETGGAGEGAGGGSDPARRGGLALRVAAASGLEPCVMERAGVVLGALAKNSLPPPNKKIIAKLKTVTAIIKNDLLAEDI